jgi:hypothetical protein
LVTVHIPSGTWRSPAAQIFKQIIFFQKIKKNERKTNAHLYQQVKGMKHLLIIN